MTPLERAAKALREHAKSTMSAVPSKKYAALRDDLVRAALQQPVKNDNTGTPLNPLSPCCDSETTWILASEEEDCGVACGQCGTLMEFRAITNKEYSERYGGP